MGPIRKESCLLRPVLAASILAIPLWAGKQKIILQLREPLKPVPTEVVVPAVTNAKGDIRDLKVALNLGDSLPQPERQVIQAEKPLTLDMAVESHGRSLTVRLSLPQPAFIEVVLMDVYGKSLGTLLSAQCPKGELALRPYLLKENESGNLLFLAMRVNGKVAVKRVLSQVKK